MTPVVMKLIEEAVRWLQFGNSDGESKSNNVSIEERFRTGRPMARQTEMSLTEFSSLTDELLELTSILALFLRNGRKTKNGFSMTRT